MITEDEIDAALDRLSRTPDGAFLYRYLQDIRCRIMPGDPSDGALRANLGARSLAAELMAKMAEGIDQSGGYTGTVIDASASERPVVFLAARPVGRSRESFRERAIRTDPELAPLRVNTDG